MNVIANTSSENSLSGWESVWWEYFNFSQMNIWNDVIRCEPLPFYVGVLSDTLTAVLVKSPREIVRVFSFSQNYPFKFLFISFAG